MKQLDKFLGLGLKNLFGVSFFIILLIILLKVAVNKKPIPGVTEAVNSI